MNEQQVDVAIIGGGPAGLTAATELRRLGVERVVVLEREAEAGGIPRHCGHPTFGLRDEKRPMKGPKYAELLTRRANNAGALIKVNTTALELGAGTDRSVVTTSVSGLERWQAKAVILASGCRERSRSARLIPGIRGPGILTTGELQQLTYNQGKTVGKRAVVLGDEHVSVSAMMTLIHAGTRIVGLISPSAKHQTPAPVRMLSTGFHSVPTFLGHRIVEILGRGRVDGVIIEDASGGRSQISCDTVVMTGDWVAEGSLAVGAGANTDLFGGGRPVVDTSGQTSLLGLFSAGGVVRPGETSFQAVRTGLSVAQSTHAFLGGHLERGQAHGQLSFVSPIKWVSPQLLYPGQSGPFRMRVNKRIDSGVVVASTGGQVVDSMALRRMVPGQTYVLNEAWCKRVLGSGKTELELSIEGAT